MTSTAAFELINCPVLQTTHREAGHQAKYRPASCHLPSTFTPIQPVFQSVQIVKRSQLYPTYPTPPSLTTDQEPNSHRPDNTMKNHRYSTPQKSDDNSLQRQTSLSLSLRDLPSTMHWRGASTIFGLTNRTHRAEGNEGRGGMEAS